MKTQTTSSSGIGFCSLLQIAFIVLKLIDKIDWSWWWVLAPTWVPLLIVLALVLWYFIALVRACARLHERKNQMPTNESEVQP